MTNMATGRATSNLHAAKTRGFTIVELLIVIVVIAVLAAITIVAYNGISNRAKASAAQSAASQATKKVMAYAVENSDTYPADLSSVGVSSSGDTSYQYSVNNTVSPRTYCITATTSSVSYFESSTTPNPTAGACAGHGVNGVPAITNLAINPSIETNITSYGANVSTATRDTAWAQDGTASIRITPSSGASSDSFINLGGDLGAFRLGMTGGKTYTLSGTVRLSAAQTGTLSGAARRLTAWYTTAGGSHVQASSTQATNAAGSTRLSVSMTIPSDAIAAWVRLYNGAMLSGGEVWWDAIMLTEGSTLPTYADGNSPSWAWSGTTNNSSSSGPPL